MNVIVKNIAKLAQSELLAPKWLLAPSIRAGNEWLEKVARSGTPAVGFRVMTLPHLARDLAMRRLAREKITKLPGFAGTLLIDQLLEQLDGEYLQQSEKSASLAGAILSTIEEMRLANLSAADLERISFEVRGKGGDLCKLLTGYESQMEKLNVTDHAGILQMAIAQLESGDFVLPDGLRLIEPDAIEPRGLECKLLKLFPTDVRYPIPSRTPQPPATDIERLASLRDPAEATAPLADDSLRLFSAVGEVNEVREVFRRLLGQQTSLDGAELLHTDYATYVPLIYEMATGLAAENAADRDAPVSIPVTFAEGIPVHYGRPGRALAAWLHWMRDSWDQTLLVRMLQEGLLQTGAVPHQGVAAALRTLPIGNTGKRYLPKINEKIESVGKKIEEAQQSGDGHRESTVAAHERLLANLEALGELCQQLLSLSEVDSGEELLTNSVTFLAELTYGHNEIDNYARDALLTEIRTMQAWLPKLGTQSAVQVAAHLETLAQRKRILGSGPRPGKLHVANALSGGHSSRPHTFILGLDDGRFPGHAMQDPILLDSEREQLSESLIRSGEALEMRIDDLIRTACRIDGALTLSYPCWDLADDRERFPSPLFLAAYRILTGNLDADQEQLTGALQPPASFVGADSALDETEWWLARLCGPQPPADPRQSVLARYPHLATGDEAATARRSDAITPFDGIVPAAGAALDPCTSDKPVSASGLETAGSCPLRYFFRYGLGIYPLDELQADPDLWLTPLEFGSLLHETFEIFLTQLVAEEKVPNADRDFATLLDQLEKQIADFRDSVPPPSEAAFLRQREELETACRIFLDVETDYCRTHQPEMFEAAIGMQASGPGTPLDRLEPAEIHLPGGGSLRTRGQIDRIDRMSESRFSICDYKTGSAYKFKKESPFQQGRVVQNALYLAMIEPILKEHYGPEAEAAEFNYFFPSQKVWGRRIGWTREELAEGLPTIDRLCRLIAQGLFLPTDDEKNCGYCDYKAACGDTKALAAASKIKIDNENHTELVPLRELRRSK